MIPKIPITILGKRWRIRVLPKKQYVKKHGKNTSGVCKGWKREIDIGPWGLDRETLAHEITHAYFYEMTAKQTVESLDGLEEFFCELLARRGYELLAKVEKAHKAVRKIVGGKK